MLLKKRIEKSEIPINLNGKDMVAVMEYNNNTKLLSISYNVSRGTCRTIDLPNTDSRFARKMIKEFNEELAKEIFKIDIIC